MINYRIDKDFLVVTLPESINSANGDAVEAELKELCKNRKHLKLILEADNTVFISSRGLRIFLNIMHAGEQIRIVKVSAEVYNVFEMTGFTKIFNIDRAFRRVELKEENILGRGATGAVYRINDDEIVKVSYKQSTPEELRQEISAAQQALINGVPTAISYDVVECGNGHLGTVYEAINSQTFSSWIMDHPTELDSNVEKYVELLKCIHNNHMAPAELPRLNSLMEQNLEELRGTLLSDDAVDAMLRIIPLLPDGDALVHGDCHPKNVMISDGSLLFIDIGDICVGHPMFDIIGFYMAEVHTHTFFDTEKVDVVTGMNESIRSRFVHKVMQRYFGYREERLEWLMNLLPELVVFLLAALIIRRLDPCKPRDIIALQIENMAKHIDNEYLYELKQRIDSWSRDF